jgi:hypothetical protein
MNWWYRKNWTAVWWTCGICTIGLSLYGVLGVAVAFYGVKTGCVFGRAMDRLWVVTHDVWLMPLSIALEVH